MIYDALLVPHETPTLLRDIKRALLTYDHVMIPDPTDRDIIPRNAFLTVIFGVPLLGMDTGAVRPMGKAIGFQDSFATILDSCGPAVRQGLLSVVPTYAQEQCAGLTVGGVNLGGYPLQPRDVFWLYRSMASDQTFLRNAISKNVSKLLQELEVTPDLALEGCADGKINNIPALPLLDVDLPKDRVSAITLIARARIGSFIKYCGYCEAKNLVPILKAEVYGDLARRLLNNVRSTFEDSAQDPFWHRRNRVLEFCHEEFLVDERLDRLSIEDVIRLRTRAWGQQAKAREALFNSIAQIAKESGDGLTFEEQVHDEIIKYRKASDEVVNERADLGFKLKCDLGSATLTGAGVLAGLLSQLQSPLASFGLTLAAGSIWAFDKAKDYIPKLRGIRSKEAEMKRGAAFGLHDFYSRIPN